MKNTVLGLVLAAFATTSVSAGSLGDPVIEQDIVAAQAASPSAPGAALVLALLTLAVVFAAAD